MCLNAMLLKSAMRENCQAALWGHNGLAGTKLDPDEDLMPAQQAHKSEMWPLFKEAKATSKRAFGCVAELFVNDTQICPNSFV
jgi:hypothetical protein